MSRLTSGQQVILACGISVILLGVGLSSKQSSGSYPELQGNKEMRDLCVEKLGPSNTKAMLICNCQSNVALTLSPAAQSFILNSLRMLNGKSANLATPEASDPALKNEVSIVLMERWKKCVDPYLPAN